MCESGNIKMNQTYPCLHGFENVIPVLLIALNQRDLFWQSMLEVGVEAVGLEKCECVPKPKFFLTSHSKQISSSSLNSSK